MVTYDTLVIGAGCWSAGVALSGRSSTLIVDRGAIVGAEYFDTFRSTSNWKSELHSAEAREFFRTLDDRGGINGERSDAAMLAPFLYKALLPYTAQFRLWTEIAAIRPEGNGFTVTLFDADGSEEIHAERIIDTTPECRSNPAFGRANCKAASLTAVAIAPNAAEMMALWHPVVGSMRPGRTDDELFFTVPVEPGESWPASREKLLRAWNSRREIFFKLNKIAMIARQRALELESDEQSFAPNHWFLNSARFANPLLAIDAGIRFGRK
ncbi:hypothetical protein [uncultured Victivallis sp.]|uniref:hypothetical protein n=1 Tax=uncultured Victivallis sp. TaxID=354118 RepID=UPI0025D4D1F4|nr:hypothetical protein [uncultured Victivallis sp.]